MILCNHCHRLYDPEATRHTPEAQWRCHEKTVLRRRSFLMMLGAVVAAPALGKLWTPDSGIHKATIPQIEMFTGVGFSDLISTTIEARSREIMENVSKSNALFLKMQKQIRERKNT